MKQRILLSTLILLTVCGLSGAVELPWSAFHDVSQTGSSAYRENELIVRFADPDPGSQLQEGPAITGPWSRRTIRTMIADSIVAGTTVKKEYDAVAPGLAAVGLPEGTNVLDAFLEFNGSGNVLYAEPNYKYKLFLVPNDPNFADLWGLDNTGQTGGTADADIDAPEAWDIVTGNPDIIVAITDTGVDYDHPDLKDNMWVNAEELNGNAGVDDDGNGYVDDIYGYDFAGAVARDPDDDDSDPNDMFFHGTHVAGTIGAVGNNSVGVTGICWNVKMMALKIFADDFRVEPTVFVSEAVEAIGYAVNNGAKIINASWGGDYFSQSLHDAIKDAGDAGLLFVAATGNDRKNNDVYPVYPANFDLDNIIAVMSTDHNDKASMFSNYGASSVDIAEPGTDVLSTTPTYQTFAMTVFGVDPNYDTLSGTSMSAPCASGSCALVWAKYPTLPNRLVKGILLKTVDPTLTTPRLCLSGGRINLYRALTLIPSGKAGKVLNTKDDPTNQNNLYSTIREAIDDANDGDVLIAEAGTLFIEAIDFKGKAITLRSGNITDPNHPSISPEDTYILGLLNEGSAVTFENGEGPDSVLKGFTVSWGNANFGGGIRCDGTSPTISDCIISNNFAKFYGGGIDCYNASPTISNCTIKDNRTLGSSGIGGGVNFEQSSAVITNCLISHNFADNIGGGMACYRADPVIVNCIIANNSAIYQAGGIHLENSSPVIANCTVVVDDPNTPKDGGIFAHNDSFPLITNCILWGNGDDLYNCSATYSNIEDKDRGEGNIHVNPMFVTGPLGNYYLSQIAAGQLADSPCVNAGNPRTDPALQIDAYTTRTDGVPDAGDIIDMGAHFEALPANLVPLNITVVYLGFPLPPYLPMLIHGHVDRDPNVPLYREYEVVRLTAHPDPGYRIKEWTGTNNDSSTGPNNTVTISSDTNVTIEFEEVPLRRLRTEVVGGHGLVAPYHRRGQDYPDGTVVTLTATPDQTYIVDRWAGTDNDLSWSGTNTVTMDSDKEITVTFRRPKSLHVPGQYQSISQAIQAAYPHGDTIIVSPGTYSGGNDFDGKAITIVSERPDDPSAVAATIIQTFGTPAFIFQSGEGHDSVVDGFTIAGFGDLGLIFPPTDTGGTGAPGLGASGGAISCLNGSSPTLANLVIRDVVARGQDGEDATFVFDPPDPAPDPLDPLDPNDQLPDPDVPDPADPNHWAPADPNRPPQPDPDDPNASAPGFDGQDGAPGLPGEPGAAGIDGAAGFPGGDGGAAYGGAMYFDANSAPIILNCTIIKCQAIGADGGSGGQGQDGGDGQEGQPGQDGQQGQNGGEGLGDGDEGAGGNGGNGGDGGPGGPGGKGGDGGKGGQGGEALGGAIYFGPNCRPTIRFCKILNCSTRQGLGDRGGAAGNGGNGGVGAEPGEAGDGGDGSTDGQAGSDGVSSPGGNGGDGGIGGDMGINGVRSWAGAIYFGENCQVDMADTTISHNAATTIVPAYTYSGGDGGDGGTGGDGDGSAPGGTGGIGGDGGAGGPPLDPIADTNDPNIFRPGIGGIGGPGGAGGEDGTDGLDGFIMSSYTTGYGGAHYYDVNCHAELRDCTISFNASRQPDGSGLYGGGEYYQTNCTALLNRCDIIGNLAGLSGAGGGQYFNPACTAQIRNCNYIDNSAGTDGGGLSSLSDSVFEITESSFIGNSAIGLYGRGGAMYGGGVWDWLTATWYNGNTVTISNSYFGSNDAAFGGALHWHGDGADVSVSGSVISGNTAEHGGGMFWAEGAPTIADCSITGNSARTRRFMPNDIVYQQYFSFFSSFQEPVGGGGGIFCWSSDAQIENCFITGNSSARSGGGVYLAGAPSLPKLQNCVVRGNSTAFDGGGIVSYWLTTPTISNCTIADNTARDPENANQGRGGGLASSYQSRTTLINSILWGNTAAKGNQLSVGSIYAPFYIDRPATLTVSYCDVQGGKSRDAVHVEPGRALNWLGGNINADPLFVGSSLNLSQVAAGQAVNSPCVNAGSGSAASLGLDTLSTRSDGVGDTGAVDMGFHYSVTQGKYQLTVKVIGGQHGSVKPLGGMFDRFSVVRLQATADPGYQVRWIGTDDDGSHALSNRVTMDSNKTVTAEFTKYAGKTVTVPGTFPTIQEAVNNAKEGDTIVVDPGRYFGGADGISVLIDKPVTITSRNPDDPGSVAATIIDGYIGTNPFENIGIYFGPNADSRTVLNGITIENCGGQWSDGDDGDRDDGHPDGEDGSPGQGAAILIDKGAAPIIKNCILRNNLVYGGNGGSGVDADGDDPILNAGRGGWAGWAHGGAIYCAPDSSPKFINCVIENNVARGGDAGNGGDGGGANEGYANYGGNYSRSQAIFYDPFSDRIDFAGNLWQRLSWDFASTFRSLYDEPNLTSFVAGPEFYSGLGAGAFCDLRSNVSFVNCEIRGNRTYGGMSGSGGDIAGTGRNLEPLVPFEMPTYGAGVYCGAESTVSFTSCTFENNIASDVLAGVDPNHRLDPFIGYGGGVCAQESAAVTFVDCNFVGNQADSGGAIYVNDTTATVVDCNIAGNAALRGGGFASTNGVINMIRTKIARNRATPDADANDPDIQSLPANGAGLYCSLGGLNVQDCNISGNLANFSGGAAYLRDVNNASFINSLILNNGSGRDGGGISANWHTAAVIANCTVAGNAGIGNIGEPNDTGFGGGLFCGYDSDVVVTDSIFWNNFARKGNAIAVGSDFQFDSRPSRLSVSYSDIKDGQAGVWVDKGSTVHWGNGNINKDPLFTAGPLGDYYLSQTDSGQSRMSPAVDAGSDFTSIIGLVNYTTRTDEAADLGRIDVGFHHPIRQPCRLADLALDGIINFRDFAKLADAWLEQGCSKQNSWCQGTDLTSDTLVDFRDVLYLADCWLVQDTSPPDPNPSRWETEPNLVSASAIRMIAETALDAWGWDVEYFFDCIDGGGCNDSGWQKSPTYTDTGLTSGVLYGYRVKTRDALGNEGEWSEPRYAGLDSTPPAPAPYIETTLATPTSIAMIATTAYDDSEVEYYFENVAGNGHDSGWLPDPNYTDTGLDPNTEYSYRVRARDRSSNLNTTPWSETIVVRTLVAPDLIPPTPDPMQWDPTVVDPNGDGTPHEEFGGGGSFDYYAVMTAVVATDAGGGPVEYFFECTTESGFSSGWIATPTYRVLVGRQGQGHRFRVRARDQFGNVTAWSPEDVAD